VRGPREAIDLPGGAELAILRLDADIAAAPGDPVALRQPSPGATAGGGRVLDPSPPRGVSRRRLTRERAAALARAVEAQDDNAIEAATLDLHGVRSDGGRWRLAPDVRAALADDAAGLVAAHHAAQPDDAGLPLVAARAALALAARRRVTVPRAAAEAVAGELLTALVADGTLARDGERLRDPGRASGLPAATLAAMDRLEAALSIPAPPALSDAARAAGCPPDGVRALELAGRIVRLEDDLAWSATTYRELVKRALAMAASGPLSPAAFRDATGTSRRYVLVVLEDLDRRGLLRRTDAGHVLGPKAIARMEALAAAAADPRP
jgi:selenocysteine-specific elongation factor